MIQVITEVDPDWQQLCHRVARLDRLYLKADQLLREYTVDFDERKRRQYLRAIRRYKTLVAWHRE